MKPPSSEEISEIKATLSRIEKALVGDQAMGHVGIVDRVGDHETRLDSIERERRDEASQRRGALWVVSAVGAIAGAVGGFVAWVAGVFGYAPKH